MEQRISLITLGVTDIERSKAFYAALGWSPGAEPAPDIAFFQANGIVLSLWDREKLAADSGVENGSGFGGVTLAYNVATPALVDSTIAEATSAGARVTRQPAETFWGGYSGVFLDPDDHPWEVAHNPFWSISDDGNVSLS